MILKEFDPNWEVFEKSKKIEYSFFAMTDQEEKVKDVIQKLGIPFTRHEHPPVFTVEQAEEHWGCLVGAHCKNLFLRNNKGNRHYLIIAEAAKTVNLKALTSKLIEDRLSFASPERLMRFLGIEPGSVSPFGLINDAAKEVRVIVDHDLRKHETVNFHPNINTATYGISFRDFEKFLAWTGQTVTFLEL